MLCHSLHYEFEKAAFGRNIIITDNTDWTTAEIVQASYVFCLDDGVYFGLPFAVNYMCYMIISI